MAEQCQSKTIEPPAVTADQLKGVKQLRKVAGLLAWLHKSGCDRYKAGNRELHFNDYVLLILLYLFNPMIDSIRMLEGERAAGASGQKQIWGQTDMGTSLIVGLETDMGTSLIVGLEGDQCNSLIDFSIM